jgi:hypothetical protein
VKSGDMVKSDKWFMQPIPPKKNARELSCERQYQGGLANPSDKPAESYAK